MSLVYTVTTLIGKRGPLSIDQLVADPECDGYTRRQVLNAVKNAGTAGKVHCVSPAGRTGVYAKGPSASRAIEVPSRAVNSVWQLADRAAQGARP